MSIYVPGFGNHIATEAVDGALPIGRNSPQKVPYGLYAEPDRLGIHRAKARKQALMALPASTGSEPWSVPALYGQSSLPFGPFRGALSSEPPALGSNAGAIQRCGLRRWAGHLCRKR